MKSVQQCLVVLVKCTFERSEHSKRLRDKCPKNYTRAHMLCSLLGDSKYKARYVLGNNTHGNHGKTSS